MSRLGRPKINAFALFPCRLLQKKRFRDGRTSMGFILGDYLLEKGAKTILPVGSEVPAPADPTLEPKKTTLVFGRIDLAAVLAIRKLEPNNRNPSPIWMIRRIFNHPSK